MSLFVVLLVINHIHYHTGHHSLSVSSCSFLSGATFSISASEKLTETQARLFCFFKLRKTKPTKTRGEEIIKGEQLREQPISQIPINCFGNKRGAERAGAPPLSVGSLPTAGPRAHPTELRLHVNLPVQMCATPTGALLGSAHTQTHEQHAASNQHGLCTLQLAWRAAGQRRRLERKHGCC